MQMTREQIDQARKHLREGGARNDWLLPLCDMAEASIRFDEALTASGDTKAEYIGEFSFNLPVVLQSGREVTLTPNVPWTTIKKIMKAIKTRATREPACR